MSEESGASEGAVVTVAMTDPQDRPAQPAPPVQDPRARQAQPDLAAAQQVRPVQRATMEPQDRRVRRVRPAQV